MIIGFSLLAIILICVLVIPNIVNSIGLIKVRDDALVGVEDNWLIVNQGNRTDHEYRKLAEVYPVEGYELAEVTPGSMQDLTRVFFYKPTGENAPADEYYIQAGKRAYDEIIEVSSGMVQAYATEVLYCGEEVRATAGENNVAYYVLEYGIDLDDSEEGVDMEYYQNVYLYIESGIEGCSVSMAATNTVDDPADFRDRDAMVEMILKAAELIVVEK